MGSERWHPTVIHSTYLLSIYCVPDTVLGTGCSGKHPDSMKQLIPAGAVFQTKLEARFLSLQSIYDNPKMPTKYQELEYLKYDFRIYLWACSLLEISIVQLT